MGALKLLGRVSKNNVNSFIVKDGANEIEISAEQFCYNLGKGNIVNSAGALKGSEVFIKSLDFGNKALNIDDIPLYKKEVAKVKNVTRNSRATTGIEKEFTGNEKIVTNKTEKLHKELSLTKTENVAEKKTESNLGNIERLLNNFGSNLFAKINTGYVNYATGYRCYVQSNKNEIASFIEVTLKMGNVILIELQSVNDDLALKSMKSHGFEFMLENSELSEEDRVLTSILNSGVLEFKSNTKLVNDLKNVIKELQLELSKNWISLGCTLYINEINIHNITETFDRANITIDMLLSNGSVVSIDLGIDNRNLYVDNIKTNTGISFNAEIKQLRGGLYMSRVAVNIIDKLLKRSVAY